MMPYAQVVEEARHYVQKPKKNDRSNVGDRLVPKQEQEIIVECEDDELTLSYSTLMN